MRPTDRLRWNLGMSLLYCCLPCDKHGMLRSSAHDACDLADLPRPVTTEPEGSHLAGGCTGHRAQWGSRDQEGITVFGGGLSIEVHCSERAFSLKCLMRCAIIFLAHPPVFLLSVLDSLQKPSPDSRGGLWCHGGSGAAVCPRSSSPAGIC